MNRKLVGIGMALSVLMILTFTMAVAGKSPAADPSASLLASGLEGASGSTIGPDRALYVAEGAAGRISRIDLETGNKTTYATGLPPAILPIGGAVDIEFLNGIAYVLVSMVGADLPVPGGNSVVGIYRMDSPTSFTPIADLGEFSINNPSESEVFIPSGVYYAMDSFRNGFLVTDGHHNRVLQVKLNGEVSEFIAFGNIVPTGLAIRGSRVFMAEAGPNPHLPGDGKVMLFRSNNRTPREIAAGAPLLVDVEFGRGRKMYALAQGEFLPGSGDGSPALPNTGSLVEVNWDGTFSVIIEGLNQPTSMEIMGSTAYVVTLGGEVWKIDNISEPPYGK